MKEISNKSCIFFKDDGFIGKAIIAAQNIYWKEQGKESQWSHIGFIGTDNNFYESTIKIRFTSIKKKLLWFTIKIPQLKYIYGIYVTNKNKRLKNWQKHYSQIGFQTNFTDLKESDWEKIIAYGNQLKKEKIKYGGIELFGTLITLIKWKLTKDPKKRTEILKKKNPFDKSNVYCIAFVANCFKIGADIDYTDAKINASILTVDHGWFTKLKQDKKIYKK